MINYHDKIFRPIINSENGEVTTDTLFHYKQEGNILTCDYKGGQIIKGHLIGLVDDCGRIDMRYHQVNIHSELTTGICTSTPNVLPNKKIRLHETWRWTSGDGSGGSSVIEEV
jgi:hypothetical protein